MSSEPESQLASAVLMIRPVRFQSNPLTAESNRFQGRNPDSPEKQQRDAAREFDGLVEALRGEGPFEVNFHVSDKSGSDKFFNVYIEGVNLLLTERTEIGAMLDARGGDLNRLIKDLKNTG